MRALKAIPLAIAVAIAGLSPAAAQDNVLALEDLVIPGLVIAGGLLAYQAYEDSQNDNDRYYDRWYDSRYDRWRNDRRRDDRFDDRWYDDRARFNQPPPGFRDWRFAAPPRNQPPYAWGHKKHKQWHKRHGNGHRFDD